MSFLENMGIGGLKEEDKIRTAAQSLKLIEEHINDYTDMIGFRNHKSFKGSSERLNIYRFTCKLLSLDLLSKMGKDKRVKNVFFSPSTPPPGAAMDSISMRYKVYVEYY
tara:strand:+ start:252 stop:578 length:327 start_codon:yes stop_codon:yes gene_type:complete